MENSEAGTSGDAAPASGGEYEVLLNFRGPDTRAGFTDFLYNGLIDAGVHVFRDDDELRVGEVIGENLLSAINNSVIYIPIFSRTYASSKWCLWELAHIVDTVSKSKDERSIFPIFFNVEPLDVKLKTPIYRDALLKHERSPIEVEKWRAALTEVGKIKGWNVKSSQATIVNLVVKEVLVKLKIKQKLVTENLVGLDDRIKELRELFDVNHDDVRLIGIYGMGGIGKTTIAKAIFNELCPHFGKCCSFLEGVRERSTKEGIVPLQKKLLSDIGSSGLVENINDSDEGMRRIGAILSNKKVLVVMDDVDKKVHIKNLRGNSKLFRGSRIIITTRDSDILQVERSEVKIDRYEMQVMDDGSALRLFCQHAFRKDYPSNDYHDLSKEVVLLMGGLPLAIEVVGSLLKDRKDKKFWEETLVKLREVPEEEIVERLRISYNDLDESQKKIFLDIACFFFNKKKIDAIYMWESCKFFPIKGIEVLTKRCLIKILDDETLWMHDQLKALGRKIVREDSLHDLGKHSRLWIAEEALQIIKTEERKHMVEALEISAKIRYEDFERLPNLRFLYLNRGTYVGDFARCDSKLKWFSWCSPAKDFGAYNLYLNQLVVCKLFGIDFKDNSKAWNMIKHARDLKVLSFTWCSGITTIPDISTCSVLERLTLGQCSSLKRIDSFIEKLRSLIELKIEGCCNFTDLPEEVGALVNLEHFSLSRCSMLRELPSSIGNLTSLTELELTGTIIRELPNSIGKLESLRILRYDKPPVCLKDHNWQFPSGISTLVNLKELDLSGHDEMKGEIPIGIEKLSSLEILNLESTGICGIPRTIDMLHQLKTLNLSNCHGIRELPELPTSLTCLLLQSESLLPVPDLSNLTNLEELLLSNYHLYGQKSNPLTKCNLGWIGRLSRLKKLKLDLFTVPAPQELASLSHLEELVLRHLDLKPLVQLPSSDWSWGNLSTLEIGRREVVDIPLEGLPQLKKLTVGYCIRLQRLSIPLKLGKLRQVHVLWCPELVEIQVVGTSESLEILEIDYCELLTRVRGLSCLKRLEILSIKGCNLLTTVEGLDELESLKYLDVWKYPSLRSLINASCTKIPADCIVHIWERGDSNKDSIFDMLWRNFVDPKGYFPREMLLEHDGEEVLQDTSNKMEHPFTIEFILNTKQSVGVSSVTWRKEIDSVTYEGLIAEVKGFGFLSKRMWYKTPNEDGKLFIEIKSDEQMKGMVQLASKVGLIELLVEGEVDISSEGAMIRGSQSGSTVHSSVFFFCVALFLFLSLKLVFPRKIGQLDRMRGFSPCEDFVAIFVLLLFLFFGVKINWDESRCDGMNLDMVTETIFSFLAS